MTLKVLTVDDSKTIRMIVKKAFKPYACEVIEAENGVEGLAAVSRETPDLIVLDITMPIMNGVEMLQKLKKEPGLSEIPVIMLTAESGKENVVEIVQMGVNDYIVKPFKGEQLVERVEKIVKLPPRDPGSKPDDGPTNKYFRSKSGVLQMLIPDKVTRPVILEIEGHLQAKSKEASNGGSNKLIIDLHHVSEASVSLIKLLITVIECCRKAGMRFRLVGSKHLAEELKQFQETGGLTVANDLEAAVASFEQN